MTLTIYIQKWNIEDENGMAPIDPTTDYLADMFGLPDSIRIENPSKINVDEINGYVVKVLYRKFGFYPCKFTWVENK